MSRSDDDQEKASNRIVFHVFENSKGVARPSSCLESHDDHLPTAISARRSHTKSRAGCARCKVRRVKCGEEKPVCKNCVRRGIACAYGVQSSDSRPVSSSKKLSSQNSRVKSTPAAYPSAVTVSFTINDMRFFHHFLMHAKPHMPVGNENVWSREIPQLAQHHPYLMDAMLALGSTHLGRMAKEEHSPVPSLRYRTRAISGLRAAVVNPKWLEGDADAVIAAGYALAQQSVHIGGAMFEWLSLLRMIYSIITTRLSQEKQYTTAFDLSPERRTEYTMPYLQYLPTLDSELLQHDLSELARLLPTLREDLAQDLCNRLTHCLLEHQISPLRGYVAFGSIFAFWFALCDAEFAAFNSPNNREAQLLVLHFIALLLMMVPSGIVENHKVFSSSTAGHIVGILNWAHLAFAKVPEELHQYTSFPRKVIGTAELELRGGSKIGVGVLQIDKMRQIATELGEL